MTSKLALPRMNQIFKRKTGDSNGRTRLIEDDQCNTSDDNDLKVLLKKGKSEFLNICSRRKSLPDGTPKKAGTEVFRPPLVEGRAQLDT